MIGGGGKICGRGLCVSYCWVISENRSLFIITIMTILPIVSKSIYNCIYQTIRQFYPHKQRKITSPRNRQNLHNKAIKSYTRNGSSKQARKITGPLFIHRRF